MWEYSPKVKDHFLNPRNVGEVQDADGSAEVGSMACGDALKLTFKVDERGVITDARFQTFGCASAIASASALTEMIKGKTIEEASRLTNQDIADYLDGLPKEKMHCSVLGRQALEAAIADFRGVAAKEPEGKVLCECFGVTDRQVERAIRENGLRSVEEVTNYTKAGGGCERCHDGIRELLARVREQSGSPPKSRLTNIQKIRLIEQTIENEIRPLLRKDGGDIELIDVVGDRVLVATRGTCAACQASQQTLKHLVEARMREHVAPEIVVEEVAP
jgi:NifU-like protein